MNTVRSNTAKPLLTALDLTVTEMTDPIPFALRISPNY